MSPQATWAPPGVSPEAATPNPMMRLGRCRSSVSSAPRPKGGCSSARQNGTRSGMTSGRGMWRDDFHRRLAASAQQAQHMSEQVLLCERRIDELTHQRDLAAAQSAHIAQRAAEREAQARAEIAVMEGRTSISETALMEVSANAQMGIASAEAQRQLIREGDPSAAGQGVYHRGTQDAVQRPRRRVG